MQHNAIKNILIIAAVAFLALIFSACSPNHLVYNQEQSASLGFNVDENSVLENPAQDQIRVYAARTNFFGTLVSYDFNVNYSPKLQDSELVNFKDFDDKLGAMKFPNKFSKDLNIEEGKPLALVASTTDFGQYSFLYFTPTKGKIYCVKGNVIFGAIVGRPNLSFITKEECEELFSE
ncbi:hypothetical protein CQA38_01970 [Campylobacter sp. MIT 12-5580]|uniref:hypothetical protein n=1 Tax=Campylobacter sp. MIT 12-5580 TaxID=2040651 RepID=UPI0010F63526|nr:hypothetical protein [Campylobacter sp. MIT 12-5580]TKX29570.1 hypothetical protein CQA38_01970 [Campylobacter sp. MIT 12-5580]